MTLSDTHQRRVVTREKQTVQPKPFEFICGSDESFLANMNSVFIYSSEENLLTSSDICEIQLSDDMQTLVRSREVQLTPPSVTCLDLKLHRGTFSVVVLLLVLAPPVDTSWTANRGTVAVVPYHQTTSSALCCTESSDLWPGLVRITELFRHSCSSLSSRGHQSSTEMFHSQLNSTRSVWICRNECFCIIISLCDVSETTRRQTGIKSNIGHSESHPSHCSVTLLLSYYQCAAFVSALRRFHVARLYLFFSFCGVLKIHLLPSAVVQRVPTLVT